MDQREKTKMKLLSVDITQAHKGGARPLKPIVQFEKIAMDLAGKIDAIMRVVRREDISYGAMSEILAILEDANEH
jgi:hypothetical protein